MAAHLKKQIQKISHYTAIGKALATVVIRRPSEPLCCTTAIYLPGALVHPVFAQSRTQRSIEAAHPQGTPQKEKMRARVKKINQHKCLENISNKILNENFLN